MKRHGWRLGVVAASAALSAAGLPLQAQKLDLVVAATTDVHGRIRAWDYYANQADPKRSLASAATIVDSLRRQHPDRVLLVDAGDLLQGNPLTFVAAKVSHPPVHPVIAAMNVMRYDAAVLGNHEFNYGVPALKSAIAQAGFPFLAANVHEGSGAQFVAPWTLVMRSGVRVAIIGATTPGSMVWDRDNMRAARLTVSDIVPAVRHSVAEARRAKADVIVVLLHSGLDEAASYDTTATGLPSENVAARVPREIDGIDLVVYGHSHKELIDSTINGALLVQPRNWAATVAVATLSLEHTKGRWHVVAHRGQSVRIEGVKESRDVLAASDNSHRATVAWATAPAGRTNVVWRGDSARVSDQPIADLVNEVMRRETGADLSAAAVFSLDAKLDTGAITLAQLSRIYPYDNTLRAVRITGAQLRAFLEHSSRYYRTLNADGSAPGGVLIDSTVPGFNFDIVSGADYTIDLSRPLGARITRLEFRGRAVQPTDSFTLALNNYRQGGGGGYSMLAGAPVVYEKDVDIRQLLIDEVKRESARAGSLDPARYATRNWHIEPAAAVAEAFAEQSRGRAGEAAGGEATRPPANRPPATNPARSTAASGGAPPAGQRTLRIIAISDFHAALRTRADDSGRLLGGARALSAAINRAERECSVSCQSVVVDAGDLFTGTPASDWDAGRPTVAVVNRLHIAAGAVGNHEFDFGQDTLRQRRAEMRYAMLGVNVRDASGKMPTYLRADTIVTRGNVRIGIVGAASPQTSQTTKARAVRGLTFLDPAPLISEDVRVLRNNGAQVVISLLHDGARCERDQPDVCRGGGLTVAGKLTDRPDLFVMGHAHVNIAMQVSGMPVVETSSNGRAIAVVDIPLDGGPATTSIREVLGDSTAGMDPVIDSIVTAAVGKVSKRMEKPVATIAEAMPRRGRQYALGNLVTDAVRVMSKSDISVWNSDGIRADLPAGPLNYGGVHELSPFGNSVVRLRMTGANVSRYLERWLLSGAPSAHVSGVTVEYDSTAERGARITRVTLLSGAKLNPSRVYSVAINDYMLDEPDGAPYRKAISQQVLPGRDIDLLSRYLSTLPQPVHASSEARIRPITAATTQGTKGTTR